jgi:hypothetical protein
MGQSNEHSYQVWFQLAQVYGLYEYKLFVVGLFFYEAFLLHALRKPL